MIAAYYTIRDLRHGEWIGGEMTKAEAEDELYDWGYGHVLTDARVRVVCVDLEEGRARDVTEDFLAEYRKRNEDAYAADAEANAADLARGW